MFSFFFRFCSTKPTLNNINFHYSFYTPSPVDGWFDLPETKEAWYKKQGIRGSDESTFAFFTFENVNQTLYITTANPQVAQAVGSSPKLTPKFESQVWPPTNASIVYSVNTTAGPNNNAGSGLLGSIPIRFATSQIYHSNKTNPNSSDTPFKVFTPQVFTTLKDQNTANEVIAELVKNLAAENKYMGYKEMPFGALHVDAIDTASGKLKATMQFGQGPSESQNYLSVPSGLRQMITITQLTNSIVKTKFSGKYSISQGLRTLPFEWDDSISNGFVLNQLSLRLFPFALCFLMPTFVSILVQEKEDRHRMMMAMVCTI